LGIAYSTIGKVSCALYLTRSKCLDRALLGKSDPKVGNPSRAAKKALTV
jgi:hypothetical protein